MTEHKAVSRRVLFKGAAGVALSASLLSAFPARGQGTVKLGVIWPLNSSTGQMAQNATKFGEGFVNAKQDLRFPERIPSWEGIPGLGNRQLELVFADNEGRPDRSAQLVSELKQQGAVAILGAGNNPNTDSASEAAANENIPMMSTFSTASQLTKRGNDLFFRLNSDSIQGFKALFASLANRFEKMTEDAKANMPKNYTWVTTQYPGVEQDRESIRKFAEEGDESFNGHFSFDSLIVDPGLTLGEVEERVMALDPTPNDTLILHLGRPVANHHIVQALARTFPVEERPGLVIPDPGLFNLQALVETLPPEEFGGWRWVENNIQFLPAAFQADANFASDLIGPFRDQFQEQAGRTNVVNALAFTGVHAWAAVLDEAGSTKPEDLVAAAQDISLRDIMVTTWNGVSFGPTSFGDQNANTGLLPVTARVNSNGGLSVIELPGGFTPTSAYNDLNLEINPSCLMNCVAIGIEQSATAIERETTYKNQYEYDSHDTYTREETNMDFSDRSTEVKVESSVDASTGLFNI